MRPDYSRVLLALTLWPEWAYAIFQLGKDVENRTWTQRGIEGCFIAIHAGAYIGGRKGARATREGLQAVLATACFGAAGVFDDHRPAWMVADFTADDGGRLLENPARGEIGGWEPGPRRFTGSAMVQGRERRYHDLTRAGVTTGAIVGIARVRAFVIGTSNVSPWLVPTRDTWGWQLEDVTPLAQPIPTAGSRKLWQLSTEQRDAMFADANCGEVLRRG